MTTAKKYKLLRDVPDSKAGDIYIWDASQEAYYKDGNVLGSYWTDAYVENNPTWFQEVNEGVEVSNVQLWITKNNSYGFNTSKPIPEDKLPLIKEAISKCINEVEDKPIGNKSAYSCTSQLQLL